MNLKEIKALDDAALLAAYYWIAVRTTKEVNTRKGLTKATEMEEARIMDEVLNRFNVDADAFHKILNKI